MLNLKDMKIILDVLEAPGYIDKVKKVREKLRKIIKESSSCKEYLWEFNWDCGRQGNLDGIFKATQEEIDNLIGKEIYFGEVLGKHSEIYGIMEKEDIKLISKNPVEVNSAKESGFNPLGYLED